MKTICAFVVVAAIAACALADDEIQATARLYVQNGFNKSEKNVQSLNVDQAGTYAAAGVVAVSTGTNTLPVNADVATAGWAWFRNVSTNTRAWVSVNMLLYPGEFALLPIASTNVTAWTTNGTANLDYQINAR